MKVDFSSCSLATRYKHILTSAVFCFAGDKYVLSNKYEKYKWNNWSLKRFGVFGLALQEYCLDWAILKQAKAWLIKHCDLNCYHN